MSTSALSTVPFQPTPEGASVQTPSAVQAPSIIRIKPKDWSSEHKTYNLLNEENWQSWRDDILLVFNVCSLDGYVNGTLKCPEEATDALGAENWRYNDKYTRKVIRDRLSTSQKYHTSNCDTAREMWANLKAIHQSCGDQTENQLMRELTDMKAKDGDDIIVHLSKLKQLWDPSPSSVNQTCQSEPGTE
jgi:hypothetical protein